MITELYCDGGVIGSNPSAIGGTFAFHLVPFGNFSVGRFAWRLNLVRRDFEPFPVHGHQGFFYVPDELIDEHLLSEVKQ